MGIHVHLAIIAERVSEEAWQRIYEKARQVATRWTPPPLSAAWRRIGDVQVAQYTPEIDCAEGLHIVGDAQTLTTAENFIFPVALSRRRRRRSNPIDSRNDVLLAVARGMTSPEEPLRYDDLFGAKTQGLPYHTLIVALGMLVEHQLPGTALVYGELSVEDGEEARRGLSAILAEDVALPAVLDEARTRRRLAAAMDGDDLEEAIRALVPDDVNMDPHRRAVLADLLGAYRNSAGQRLRRELEHVVASCRDLDLLAAETRNMLREVVAAIHALMVRHEIRHRVQRWGAARTLEEIATVSSLRLTSRTWDRLEAADLDELSFVYTAVSIDSIEWHLHHAIRAVIENPAMRASTPDAGSESHQPSGLQPKGIVVSLRGRRPARGRSSARRN